MSTGATLDSPAAAPAEHAPLSRPSGGQGLSSSSSAAAQGLDLWLESFHKYEVTLVRLFLCSSDAI
jgi:hypothetical protein